MTLRVPESGHLRIDVPSYCIGGEAEVLVFVVPRAPDPEPVTEAWLAANADKLPTWEEVAAYLDKQRAIVEDDP
jgi:hypothetical protein